MPSRDDETPSARRIFLYRLWETASLLCGGAAARAAVRRDPSSSRERVARPPDAFAAALRQEVGVAGPETTDRIRLNVPAVAEDGAVVPVTLESLIPGTDRLVLFAEKNPFPLVAAFNFGPLAVPFVALRIKMNASADVVALARAGGTYYLTRKAVRVVVGGCD